MIRKALIIGCPGRPTDPGYLPGVEKDLINYQAFLTSPLGGAWNANEITTLKEPSKTAVEQSVRNLKGADFSIVVFSGHGYASSDKTTTILHLAGSDEIDVTKLRNITSKQILAVDCCRVPAPAKRLFESLAKSIKEARTLNPQQARKLYDDELDKCSIGEIALYACRIGETAEDTPEGGLYSYQLIKSAEDWLLSSKSQTKGSVLSVPDAHKSAETIVSSQTNGRQNPVIKTPRAIRFFPFAVAP